MNIGIDHGYYAIETRHFSFLAGIAVYSHEHYTLQNTLEYGVPNAFAAAAAITALCMRFRIRENRKKGGTGKPDPQEQEGKTT